MAFAEWAVAEFGVCETDRLSNHAPFHFDLSTFDLYAAVLTGAAVVLIPEFLTRFPAALAAWIAKERITIWYSVPLALIQMLERGRLADIALRDLRWILFAGEPFPVKHLRRLMSSLHPHVKYTNLYGPTETNVCTCFHVNQIPLNDDPLPIGCVCAGAEALVQDGELLIAGPTVMQRYWARPDLTERSFFCRGRKRFYRTGDLVQPTAKGDFQYLGRKDRQVKVRGYRVELDEIEGALMRHSDVQEAAVFIGGEQDSGSPIEAAVTVRSRDLSEIALIAHAATLLPAYAVPSIVTILEDLPRTSTGKINRRELLAQCMTVRGATEGINNNPGFCSAGLSAG